MLINKLLQINKTSNPTEKQPIHWRNTIELKVIEYTPVTGNSHSTTEIGFPLVIWPMNTANKNTFSEGIRNGHAYIYGGSVN